MAQFSTATHNIHTPVADPQELRGTSVVLALNLNLEGIMSLPRGRQCNRLPKHFPAGTVYVVEGCGGQYGRFRVSSRYIVMPGGRKLEIPVDSDRAARTGRSGSLRGFRKSRLGASANVSAAAKKFAVVAGTAHQERR
jgi:hypothetical protein